MKISQKTKDNLQRKSRYIDEVQLHKGVPLFSWIDINVNELCNRKCVFCPRVDENLYQNRNLHMDIALAEKLANELSLINYKGVIVFSGYGEPLLTKNLEEYIKVFSKVCRVEIITNGDFLDEQRLKSLFNSGISYFVVSMYDGPEQINKFNSLFKKCEINEENYILRDRWHSDEDGYGLKLTNRAGTINTGNQAPVDLDHPCFYPAYSMTIDWNGDVLLCMQDWNKEVKFGNIKDANIFELWYSEKLNKYRLQLMNGSRRCDPCNKCNTDGTLHGFNHVRQWKNEK